MTQGSPKRAQATEITQPVERASSDPGENTQTIAATELAKALAGAQPAVPDNRSPLHPLLARANLLRVRKQWDEAASLCQEALREWPRNPEVNALLGDIYADEGRLDDAILRYCRVLEGDPRNARGRAKLAQLVGLKRRQLSGRLPGVALPLWRADRIVRAFTLAAALVMLMTILVAPVVLQHKRQSAPVPTLDTGRDITAKPVYLQPVLPPTPPPAPNTPAPAPAGETLMLRAPIDQAVVDLLRSDTSLLAQGVQVVDADTDPRAARLTLTYLYRPVAGDPDTHGQILRGAIRLAQAVAARADGRMAETLTLRCLLLSSPPSSSGPSIPLTGQIIASTPLFFVADIPRAQIPPADFLQGSPSDTDLSAPFASLWWSGG